MLFRSIQSFKFGSNLAAAPMLADLMLAEHDADLSTAPRKARRRGQRVRKPSFVARARRRDAGRDHSSRTDVTIGLERRYPETRADRPRRLPISSCFRWGLPCDRRYRRPGELLPHPFTLAARPFDGEAVCFLWHFPRGRPHQELPGILPYEARTFLPCADAHQRSREPV